MYVVKKCENHSYGQNKWVDVHVTPDKEDAISYVRGEMYLLYASDPSMPSADIDSRMNSYWGVPWSGQSIYKRHECGHSGIHYAILNSTAAKYDNWIGRMRPDRTEALDLILGA